MKRRITKFYEDHKIAVQAFGAGVIAGAVLVTYKKRGNHITSGDVWAKNDGTVMMSVTHRNGKTEYMEYEEAV